MEFLEKKKKNDKSWLFFFGDSTNQVLWLQIHWASWYKKSGQIIIFHQPRFPWNKGISLTKPPFGVRSCEVAIIWPEKSYLQSKLQSFDISEFNLPTTSPTLFLQTHGRGKSLFSQFCWNVSLNKQMAKVFCRFLQRRGFNGIESLYLDIEMAKISQGRLSWAWRTQDHCWQTRETPSYKQPLLSTCIMFSEVWYHQCQQSTCWLLPWSWALWNLRKRSILASLEFVSHRGYTVARFIPMNQGSLKRSRRQAEPTTAIEK